MEDFFIATQSLRDGIAILRDNIVDKPLKLKEKAGDSEIDTRDLSRVNVANLINLRIKYRTIQAVTCS